MHEKKRSVDPYIEPYLASFDRYGQANFVGFRPIPSLVEVELIIEELLELLFPGRSGEKLESVQQMRLLITTLMQKVGSRLHQQIYLALYHDNPLNLADEQTTPYQQMADQTVAKLFSNLGTLRAMMKEDAQAAYEGDPAATSIRETIICYPGVRAITIHRIAHFLYQQNVPLVPRMLSESIHKQTGIDIHPGASIGRCFFIDHGTGVVIGETTNIGNRVKIYQGVTLGALSFPKDGSGELVRGTKRHPTLEDDVTVYANATLLGDIVVGTNTIIGSSTWIRENVPPNTLVQNTEAKHILRELPPVKKGKKCQKTPISAE